MKLIKNICVLIVLGVFALPGYAQAQEMTFFVTSDGPGNGGDLGGLAGADALCQSLAESAGRGDATWRAYLSQAASGSMQAVNARDRIGNGPWHNANGDLIAANVADLHEDRNNVRGYTALNENGEEVAGRGDPRGNRHDILTGSDSAGRVMGDAATTTCNNWTSNDEGAAQVGHSDRIGHGNQSWNSSHATTGCSQEDFASWNGAGLFYCFAID